MNITDFTKRMSKRNPSFDFENTEDLMVDYKNVKNQRDLYKSLLEKYEKMFSEKSIDASKLDEITEKTLNRSPVKKKSSLFRLASESNNIEYSTNQRIISKEIPFDRSSNLQKRFSKLNIDIENMKKVITQENNLFLNQHTFSDSLDSKDFDTLINDDENKKKESCSNQDLYEDKKSIIKRFNTFEHGPNPTETFDMNNGNYINFRSYNELSVQNENESKSLNMSTLEAQNNFNKLTEKLKELESENFKLTEQIFEENTQKSSLVNEVDRLNAEIQKLKENMEEKKQFEIAITEYLNKQSKEKEKKSEYCRDICNLI